MQMNKGDEDSIREKILSYLYRAVLDVRPVSCFWCYDHVLCERYREKRSSIVSTSFYY